ncbi:MAG: cyclic nucleotide-binding domain-containing protein [Candidatus Latescibacteria bacterium]|jgi:CRP-like cAMP-binding protein|nr:cyclic nucleotide-binding domain-containing protein [Candidatus Latescibacterota bacterium]
MELDQLKQISQSALAFRDFTEDMLRQLITAGEMRTVPRGEILCSEGDESTEMFILLSGELAVTGAGLELSIIDAAEDQAIVGEMSLFTGLPRSATLEVRAEATVFEVTRARLDALMKNSPDLAVVIYRNVIASLCARLRESNEEVLRSILSV